MALGKDYRGLGEIVTEAEKKHFSMAASARVQPPRYCGRPLTYLDPPSKSEDEDEDDSDTEDVYLTPS